MQEINDVLTPEKKAEVARLSTFFGIRPGATFTESPYVFDGLPEGDRPTFTFRFMSSSMKEEYDDKMTKLMARVEKENPPPAGESDEQRTMRVATALTEHRSERNAIMYPFVRKCLVGVEKLPYADGEGVVSWNGDGVPDYVWDSLSYALRPILANLLFTRSFVNEVEATAVKS